MNVVTLHMTRGVWCG